jgi:tryptophan synthase beta chain
MAFFIALKEDHMEKKIFLSDRDMPNAWYNIQADLTTPLPPPLNPETGDPVTPDMLEAIFPMNLIEQEISTERFITIPDEVMERLLMWRPTPLCRAMALEKFLGTPAQIYYKNESVSPPGSHKPNTAVAQVYYNKAAGVKRLTTETGAGQWGSALSFACSQFGMELKVYMVRVSFNQKPYRRIMMETWGGTCVASPSPDTAPAGNFWKATRTIRAVSAWRYRRPSKMPLRQRTQNTLSAQFSTMFSPINRSSALRRRNSLHPWENILMS